MTDTVNVSREVIDRAVVMAKAIMKAEPLYGCVGYRGDEQINGHVEEAADLACLVLDEMVDPIPAPNALAAAPKAEPLSNTQQLEAAKIASYEDAHAVALEMGYPSLTEALEDLSELVKDRDAFDGLSAQPEAQKGEPVELTVWYGSMPESNGRENWTAVLHRKGATGFGIHNDGFCFARSEYPERVRYEADEMRWLIGELDEKPDILSYDETKHSGYTHPAPSSELLDAMPETWEISYGEPNGEEYDSAWMVHEVRGNINDREWALLAYADTPAGALRLAIAKYKGPQS